VRHGGRVQGRIRQNAAGAGVEGREKFQAYFAQTNPSGQTLSKPVKPFSNLDQFDHEHPPAPVLTAMAPGAAESPPGFRPFADQNHSITPPLHHSIPPLLLRISCPPKPWRRRIAANQLKCLSMNNLQLNSRLSNQGQSSLIKGIIYNITLPPGGGQGTHERAE
jgi:hypothetical protein